MQKEVIITFFREAKYLKDALSKKNEEGGVE